MHAFRPLPDVALIINILIIAIIVYAELTTCSLSAGPGPCMVIPRVLTAPVGKIQAMTAGK
ncbi:MAG TPA: hypothetical protein VEG44_03670 [Candidatus Acidoferrales bacterium]|nr:hypothetical protein [Candidatus Acidoferrales bacterium]